ncbi:SDR family NAD(P)-dependent oxidoreductase [Oceaniglobus roseus]|uniref:SDR family NAD(P)-dependent oxidoreductase n=1 Tax=Oceaniglobus roseus TaxID=1737570 RepID=UPI000C7EB987|nr:SDR family NAD(P)-dependent oxidoreductase [Kandeliimicrobium roseum]
MRALVIGASGGIGAAIATELRDRGHDVTALSRSGDGLDVTDEASVAQHLGRLDGPFDLVFVATGALVVDGHQPEKSLKALSAEGLCGQFAVNAIGPALVLKHALRLIPRNRRAVFAALSARVGSIGDNGLGGWYSYRASKAALNQLIHGAAIEIGRTHRQAIAVCLHPGTVATDFTAGYPDHDKVTPAAAAKNLLDVIDGLTPDQSGGFYDYAGKEIPW